MPPRVEELLDNSDIISINPYDILGIAKASTSDEVKSAYRKAALKNHPDKVPPSQKATATKSFQTIAFAYAVLSSPTRRAHYDRTGSTSEVLSSSDDFSWSSFYRTQYEDVISDAAIEAFAIRYKNSQEEKDDILAAYEDGMGNMDEVYERVMLSDVVMDDERFRGIINEAIERGKVKAYKTFTSESNSSKRKRTKLANAEANEAMEYAQELGIKTKLFGGKTSKQGDGQEGLKDLILRRQQDRQEQSNGFLARLEAKYAKQEKKGKGNRNRAAMEDEPSEEEFLRVAARREEKRPIKATGVAGRKMEEKDSNTEDRKPKKIKR